MVEVYILKKRDNKMGNPVYEVLIPSMDKKINGLRKLKGSGRYGFSSYNVGSHLRDYVFKGRKVKIIDQR